MASSDTVTYVVTAVCATLLAVLLAFNIRTVLGNVLSILRLAGFFIFGMGLLAYFFLALVFTLGPFFDGKPVPALGEEHIVGMVLDWTLFVLLVMVFFSLGALFNLIELLLCPEFYGVQASALEEPIDLADPKEFYRQLLSRLRQRPKAVVEGVHPQDDFADEATEVERRRAAPDRPKARRQVPTVLEEEIPDGEDLP